MSDNLKTPKLGTDEVTLTENASTPSNPSAGSQKLFIDSVGRLKTLDSAGSESEVGSGGGTGVNYFENPELDADAANWTGDTNLIRTRETATPISGDGYLKIAKTAGNASTQKVVGDLKLTDAYVKGRSVPLIFEYRTIDGTKTYATGDFEVQVYRKTATAKVIFQADLERTGGNIKTFSANVFTESDSDDYEVRIVCVTSDTGTFDVEADKFHFGPSTLLAVPNISEWEAFDPTISWVAGISSKTGRKRRVGDQLEVEIDILLSGAPTATGLNTTLPDSLVMDTTKLASTNGNQVLGELRQIEDSGTDNYVRTYCTYTNSTTVQARYLLASTYNSRSITQVAPITFTTNDRVQLHYKVPISGWSAGAIVSTNELSLQTVKAKMRLLGAASHPTTGTNQTVPIDSAVFDTHGITDTTNNKIVIPKTAYYMINGQVGFIANATGLRTANILEDGASASEVIQNAVAGGIQTISSTSVTRFLEKGDEITLAAYQNSGGSLAYRASADETYLEVIEQPDFTVYGVTGGVQRSEVRLHTINGHGSTNTAIRRFTTAVTDTGSAITYADSATLGASFTINYNGIYAINYADGYTVAKSTGLSLNSAALSTGITSITAADRLIMTIPPAGGIQVASWTGYLAAGDVIRPHTDIGTDTAFPNRSSFTISLVNLAST